jgi:4-hydroxybenzoate polyprenyltransferase
MQPWIRLMRLDKPIGTLLLLWPMLWSIWLAAKGAPQFSNLVIFICGVAVMRAAGCVINDYADRHVDGHVERTKNRPLVSGEISPREALRLFFVLLLLAFLLVLQTNALTIQLAFLGLILTIFYPFVKRWSYFPQLVLGIAWAWVVPMSFAAEREMVPKEAIALFLAVVSWVMVFDSFYALVDRKDDQIIGIKSTVILWGERDLHFILLLQTLTLVSLFVCVKLFDRNWIFLLGIFITAIIFSKQLRQARDRSPELCFEAFLSSQWVGAVLFGSLALDIWLYPFE